MRSPQEWPLEPAVAEDVSRKINTRDWGNRILPERPLCTIGLTVPLVYPVGSESNKSNKKTSSERISWVAEVGHFRNSLAIGQSKEPTKKGRIDPGKTKRMSGHATRTRLDRTKVNSRRKNRLKEKRPYRATKIACNKQEHIFSTLVHAPRVRAWMASALL